MSESRTLLIHTQLAPEFAERIEAKPKRQKRRDSSRSPHAAHAAEKGRRGRRGTRVASRLSAGDRLLRNSAIACAVLLGVLALGNLRQPWAQKAVEGIEQVLTMHINLDESLGQLTFVRELMPESALVFLNVSGGSELTPPAAGDVSHPWTALQPWVMFDCAGASVRAVQSGTVTAVSRMSDGRQGVLVDHGNGLESVYAGLTEVTARSGEVVSRGEAIGTSGDGLYFELRSGGESVDPTERLGLK